LSALTAQSMMRRLFDDMRKVYRGETQANALTVVFLGALTGRPVYLMGEHGSYKSSMVRAIASSFSKNVLILSKTYSTPEEIRAAVEAVAEPLTWRVGAAADGSPSPVSLADDLEANLVAGVDVAYRERGNAVNVTFEVDLERFDFARDKSTANKALAKWLAEGFEKPVIVSRRLSAFLKQVTPEDKVNDVMGKPERVRALLGIKPPHLHKRAYLVGADVALLDEVTSNPRLVASLHTALNEGTVNFEGLGEAQVRPYLIAAAANPENRNYKTNISIKNYASLDRFSFSALTTAPPAEEVAGDPGSIEEALRELERKPPVPVSILAKARRDTASVRIPEGALSWVDALLNAMDSCYFSTSTSKRAEKKSSPFLREHDCNLCVYKSTCMASMGAVSTTRAKIAIKEGAQALAYLDGESEVKQRHVVEAALVALPHRVNWSREMLDESGGDVYECTKTLLQRFYTLFTTKQVRDGLAKIASAGPGEISDVLAEVGDHHLLRSVADARSVYLQHHGKASSDAETMSDSQGQGSSEAQAAEEAQNGRGV